MKHLFLFILCLSCYQALGQQPSARSDWQPIADFEKHDVLFLFDDGERLLAGIGGWGLFSSVDGGLIWQEMLLDSNALYPTSLRVDQDRYYLTSLTGGVYESTDGQTFMSLGEGLPPFALWASTVDQNELYVAGGEGVYVRSGGEWRPAIPEDIYGGETIFDIEAKAGLIVAGGRRTVYLRDQRSKQWRTAPFDFKFDIRNIHIFNNQTIWVGTNGDGAYLSVDQGESWTPVQNDLLRGNVIFISKSEPEAVLSVGSEGLYKEDENLNVGSPPLYFKNMVRHKEHYYAGTTDRGVWKFTPWSEQSASRLSGSGQTGGDGILLSVFPNPSNGRFSVALRQNDPGKIKGDFKLIFFDVSGKVMRRATIPGDADLWQEEWSLEVVPGIYRYDLIRKNELVQSGQLIISR